MMWLDRLLAVAAKEVRQLLRDRITMGLIVGIPTIQLLLFGYAINFDVRGVSAAVLDQSQTSLSRRLVGDLGATQLLGEIRQRPHRPGAARAHAARRGEHRDRHRAGPRAAHRRRQSCGAADSRRRQPAGARKRGVRSRGDAAPAPRRCPAARAAVEIQVAYNPEKRTAVQIVPALCGVILTMTMVIFTASAIVRERERGNLELLITTPVSSAELMAGKLLPYVAIGLIQTTLIITLGYFLFGVPVEGRLLDLYLGALLFIAASLSLGLLISTIAKTQFQAMQMSIVTMLPSILMSGFMFPFEGMPKARSGSPRCCRSPTSTRSSGASCCGARRSRTCAPRSPSSAPSWR